MIDATRKVYFSPYDDAETALLDLVGTAVSKIRLADYSYNLENLTQVLIQKHQSGVDVSLVLDKSQAAGKTEVPEITQLKNAGVPMAIGTSDKGKIMHLKVVIIDDILVGSGSYNFTSSAELEDNVFTVEHNAELAAVYTKYWQKVYDWIAQRSAKDMSLL